MAAVDGMHGPEFLLGAPLVLVATIVKFSFDVMIVPPYSCSYIYEIVLF